MREDLRDGRGCLGSFDVVLGKDDGTVESEGVLGKVHDRKSWLHGQSIPHAAITCQQQLPLENFAANCTDPGYLVNFAEN